MNNSFITLLLETLGITEAQTIELSRIIDAWNLKPCIARDVLQPALKGEKVGDTLVPIMQYKMWEKFAKESEGEIDIRFYNPHVKNGTLCFGDE